MVRPGRHRSARSCAGCNGVRDEAETSPALDAIGSGPITTTFHRCFPVPTLVSPRIFAAINALPVQPGMRVLEVGCGPGVAAREIVRRWPGVYVLGIDRSEKAIRQARTGSHSEIVQGRLGFRQVSAEAFVLEPGEPPYDLAFALRVGALDGRHPAAGAIAIPRIAAALVKNGRIFIDGGSPLKEISVAILHVPVR